MLFFLFGLPSLFMTLLVDCYYFWVSMFRKNLKKIVIERQQTTLTMKSVKDIIRQANTF